MKPANIIAHFVEKIEPRIIYLMSENHSYQDAKDIVKNESCAGVGVWDILDGKFA